MFGLKRIEKKLDDVLAVQDEDFRHLCRRINELEKQSEHQHHDLHVKLDAQKLELSKINSRFHDLGDKITKSQGHIDKLAEYGIQMMAIDDKLIQKLVADDALLVHLKEFVAKQNIIFDYMKELEKLMCNVEMIIEQCLPEKTLKLPKKKKATTDAS